MMALGATFATAISGVLRNIVGTKVTVVLVGIPTTIGWLLIIFAQSSEMVSVELPKRAQTFLIITLLSGSSFLSVTYRFKRLRVYSH